MATRRSAIMQASCASCIDSNTNTSWLYGIPLCATCYVKYHKVPQHIPPTQWEKYVNGKTL